MRTSESKGHQQVYGPSVVLDFKFLTNLPRGWEELQIHYTRHGKAVELGAWAGHGAEDKMRRWYTAFVVAALAAALSVVSVRAEAVAPEAAAARGKNAQNLPTPVVPRGAANARARGGPLDDQQRALVQRINAYLTSVHTLIGDFVQVGPDGSRTDGKFYLQKPGRVRFEYNPPSPLELVADGSSVAVRDRRLSTQDVYPLSQTPL